MKRFLFLLLSFSFSVIACAESKWVTLDSFSFPLLKVDVNSVKVNGAERSYLRQWWSDGRLVDTMLMEINCQLNIQRAVPNADYINLNGVNIKTNPIQFDTSWKVLDPTYKLNMLEKELVCKNSN